MPSRLKQLPQHHLVKQITALQKNYRALKTTGQTLGPDSVVIVRNVTGASADIVLPTNSTGGTWEVVFTPDHMTNPYAELQYTVVDPEGYAYFQVAPDANNTLANPRQRSWQVMITIGYTSYSIPVQFQVYSPDSGTITVTAI